MMSEPEQAEATAYDVDALAGRFEALRELNAELEERVAARTRELGAVNARLETVVHELPVGVIVLSSGGTIELANRPALEILGVSSEELEAITDRQPWRMFGPDGRELELTERPMFRALSVGAATSAERFRVERPDGAERLVELSAVPLREPDGGDSVIVTIQDVTQRETLERAEREFVTNAAHELQTPLAAIMSAVEVLTAGAKERPEDRDRFLQHIADACSRLGRLTAALLLLARAQVGEEARTEVIVVESFLQTVVAPVTRGREVRIECDADIVVIANRPLLEQAVANLVENAVKHTGGSIVISATHEGRRVRIVVRDFGPGIRKEEQSRIFERFYRGESAAARDGSGLGLAIVAAVARAVGAELEVDSSAQGTAVAILLPAARLVSR
jgi:two-component system phosphate regulon sensor histidine kinase PhoR